MDVVANTIRLDAPCSNAQQRMLIRRRCSTVRRGFTLLEMLVVVTLLAATAFITTMSLQGILEDTNDKLVLTEMQQIAKAIQQFKQDTGYYPKTGPFDLDTQGGAIDPADLDNDFFGAPTGQESEWFYSPANLYQLIINPLEGTTHQLREWNPATGRGWRGPYLKGYEGYLTIGEDLSDGTAGGDVDGDPMIGTPIANVYGIADVYEHEDRVNGANNVVLGWVFPADRETGERWAIGKWGRPYLVFGLNQNADITGDGNGDGAGPWIVSLGPNGFYDSDSNQPSEDDVILNIE